MAPNTSTCSLWATRDDLCSPCDEGGYTWDSALLDDALQIASDILFNLTGRQWAGLCTDTIRPCAQCSCVGVCGCNLSVVRLPNYPVVSITEVKVDGDVVPASEYRVDGWRDLVGERKSDGTVRTWPSTQDLTKAATEDDTFEVTYRYGSAPPDGGVRAAAVLGCELALACQPETVGQCRLPKRVTSITHQGVTMTVLDPQEFLAEGRTGIPEVDMWIRSVNPGGVPRRASVSSPDTAPRFVRVTTA